MKNAIPVRSSLGNEFGYDKYTIQVMQQRYKSNFMGVLETIGYITFQKSPDETKWYGMRFICDTSEFKILNNFHKLARKIFNESNSDSQPQDIINIINGVEYNIQNGDWFSVRDAGLYCFDVMEKEEIYSRLVAYNLDDAKIKIAKIQKKDYRHKTTNFHIGNSFKIQ